MKKNPSQSATGPQMKSVVIPTSTTCAFLMRYTSRDVSCVEDPRCAHSDSVRRSDSFVLPLPHNIATSKRTKECLPFRWTTTINCNAGLGAFTDARSSPLTGSNHSDSSVITCPHSCEAIHQNGGESEDHLSRCFSSPAPCTHARARSNMI